MAFSETELAAIDKAVGGLCRRRNKPELRDQLSLEYRLVRHDVLLFERRPNWDGSPGQTETDVAKLRFVRRTGRWSLLWRRANLKWSACT